MGRFEISDSLENEEEEENMLKVDLSTATNQTSSKLLSLCPELRNRIFQYVCEDTVLSWTRRSGKKVEKKWTTNAWRLERYAAAKNGTFKKLRMKERMFVKSTTWKIDGSPAAPALVLVCKQMYDETVKVLIDTGKFEFATLVTLRQWLQRANASKLSLHKNVYLNGDRISYQDLARIKAANEAPPLRTW